MALEIRVLYQLELLAQAEETSVDTLLTEAVTDLLLKRKQLPRQSVVENMHRSVEQFKGLYERLAE